MTALTILMLASAYLAGSVSSAIVVSKIFYLPNPRTHGSGNPGTTNVLRLGGRLPAVLVLLFDVLKGTVPVWLSYYLGFTPIMLGCVAIMACLGHIFPLFFSFKGGKAVATAFGAMLPIGVELAGALIACWALIVFATGYSSLAAIVAVALSPLLTYFIKPEYTVPVSMLALLIVARHKDNIVRLFQGLESKIWEKGRATGLHKK
ncbi:glycerol-3-phosphate 1-O-acyltransferase PlsY [Aliiglaciecola sp. LCG003]|uniref:glycerol-3-phosphate 1-O-acyltransferase PlsY n=1 Tax=Aliiglaciecola sp. LCG003 TaxID=3053655 RepID=UPI0025739C5B|nr:glycerol-3-phosphate 1-O-acyltransferase PlsY [Aliiglaciecola sp. LCG003]WJG08780.1 glycerol-3-phosphate 1-O-acyltransferase PlsY [Aliiglaciecola sp. LCG003]